MLLETVAETAVKTLQIILEHAYSRFLHCLSPELTETRIASGRVMSSCRVDISQLIYLN